jgi:hypothetical protein
MMLYVVVAVVALVTGIIATYLITQRIATRNIEIATREADDLGWKTGFSAGWDAASDDYFHVRNRYETLHKEREY